MSVPCCLPPLLPGQPRQCVQAPSVDECERILPGAFAGLEGTTCESEGGCYDCNPSSVGRSGCCFNQQWFPSEFMADCTACGGFVASSPDECAPPPPPLDCIPPREDESPGGQIWSDELIVDVLIGESPETGFGGMLMPMTDTVARYDGETCSQTEVQLRMMPDGYVYGELCSQNAAGNELSRRVSYSAVAVLDDSPEPGYGYDVACAQLPWWTEAIFRSRSPVCFGPET